MSRSKLSSKTAPVVSLDSERLALRLAEMVVGLTECDPLAADEAVRGILASDPRLDALEVVARATIVVNAQERPAPRVPAYLRPGPPVGRPAQPASPLTGDRGEAVVVDLRGGPADLHLDLT
jgi:hypothetical protein